MRQRSLMIGALLLAACSGDERPQTHDARRPDLLVRDGPNILFSDSGDVLPRHDASGDVSAHDGPPADVTSDLPRPDTLAAICKNGTQDTGESDVDCGGGGCPPCADGKACTGGANCASQVCTNNICQLPSCNDRVKNGGETGVDCGGTSSCGPCPDGGGCVAGTDCESRVCTNNVCQVPTCGDGVQNLDEKGVDCGGHCGPTCALGNTCASQADCESRFCDNDVCAVAANCQVLRSGGVRQDGIYLIDPNGPPTADAVPTFCDMTTGGLGWTALAANGEVLADETTDLIDCYPLISNDNAAGCGDSSSLNNDFSLPGAQQAALSWRRLLAVAYDTQGYGNKLAFFAIDFGSSAPTSQERVGGVAYVPTALTTAYGAISCNSGTAANIVHYTKAGTYNANAAYVANGKGTIFGHDSAADMSSSARRTFGFTDTSAHASGQLKGVDDYQDGWSCGDVWVPLQARGKAMVVLVN